MDQEAQEIQGEISAEQCFRSGSDEDKLGDVQVEELDDFPETTLRSKGDNLKDIMEETESTFKQEPDYMKRDPEEEFFMLAVLSLKMVHNEEFDESEYVYEISAGKLFRQVRSEKLPFHRWHRWLEAKFKEIRDAYIKENAKKDEEENQDDNLYIMEANKKPKKKSIFERFSKYIGKKEDRGRKKSVVAEEFPQPELEKSDSGHKRRMTISESIADKGQF